MGLSRILFVGCVLVVFSGMVQAKPPTLNEFWTQWNRHHLELQSSKSPAFIRSFSIRWTPAIIPSMTQDVIRHPEEGEVRSMIYSIAVLFIPDRKGCKAMISRMLRSKDPNTRSIASDFQADIEDEEKGEIKLSR